MGNRSWLTSAVGAIALCVLGFAIAACGSGSGGGATIATTTTVGANPNANLVGPNTAKLKTIFDARGPYAEGSMYACLMDALAQHLPYQQALELCETMTLEAGLEGLGEAPFDPIGEQPDLHARPVGVREITGKCSSGDPTVAADGGMKEFSKYGYDWGFYSWGTPGQGMTEQQARAAKEAAVDAAFNTREVENALDTARLEVHSKITTIKDKELRATLISTVRAAQQAAYVAAVKALEAAYEDPNAPGSKPSNTPTTPGSTTPGSTTPDPGGTTPGGTTPGGTTPGATTPNGGEQPGTTTPSDENERPAQDSECQQALQAAREFLHECNRNGWTSNDCAELEARMNYCPSPQQILVDPDQGYSCGLTVNPLALMLAAKARCEQLKRGVDGTNPCENAVLSDNGLEVEGGGLDICSDPAAYVDPESGACAGELILPDMGMGSIEELLVFDLQKFGGPIFVLPKDPDPPGWNPKPEPRPAPS